MPNLHPHQGLSKFFEHHLFVLLSFVFFIFISSCSNVQHETKPIEIQDQDKSTTLPEQQELPKDLQVENNNLQTLTFDSFPEETSISQSSLEAPHISYKIAVLLPFSSKNYRTLANNIFSAIALSLFQKTDPYKKYTLYPIDTGSTKEDFIKALDTLESTNPQIAIGPLLTQNVLSLLEKAYLFNFHFLALNSNPELTLYKRPKNVWFMDSSPIHEIQLLDKYGKTKDSLTVLLPPGINKSNIASIIKKNSIVPLYFQVPEEIHPPLSSHNFYLPLRFSDTEVFSQINTSNKFFGFNWINSLPDFSQKNEDNKVLKIIPKKELSEQLLKDFFSYLNHLPSSLELISYTALQIAIQLLDETEQAEATLAYRSALGTVYITDKGFAHYDMVIAHSNE